MKALIYCRVGRNDQNCQRQISDLKDVASSKGSEVIDIITEKKVALEQQELVTAASANCFLHLYRMYRQIVPTRKRRETRMGIL